VAFEVIGYTLKWAYRLEYLSTAGNDGAKDLSEYYTVDMINTFHARSRLVGFGACYDANGYTKQGCSSFLLFQIYDQGTSNPSGCSQRIIASKHNIVYTANAFRKYYSIAYEDPEGPGSNDEFVHITFTDSETLENLGKIGGAGANKGLIIFVIRTNDFFCAGIGSKISSTPVIAFPGAPNNLLT
jgi:hypothetical protein